LNRALRLGREYLLPHAQAAFGEMKTDEPTQQAVRVLRWLCQREEPGFSTRDVYRQFPQLVGNAEAANTILQRLESNQRRRCCAFVNDRYAVGVRANAARRAASWGGALSMIGLFYSSG
jgi:hypothetical protein